MTDSGPSIDPFVVRRSAWRMWGIALAGIPLIVLSLDVLTRRRITNALRDLLFDPQATQLFEPRDVIWAWVMLAVGLGLSLWGLKELILPTPVLRADPGGLSLKVNGPFRAPLRVPWDAVDDIGSASVDDDGDHLPVLWISFFDHAELPQEPWGSRWVEERTLALLASDWEVSTTEAARRVTEVAVAGSRSATAGRQAVDGQ